jgi:UDP-N-acetylmuramate dehydrogenase
MTEERPIVSWTDKDDLDFSLRGELRYDEPMGRYTSWRAGGNAERAYIPADLSDLSRFLHVQPVEHPVHMIGLGSNLLVRDRGIHGTVVLLHRALNGLRLAPGPQGGGVIYAEAGVAAPKVAKFAAKHDLDGAEFFAGIPGTVGGALAMNAGCYGTETWDYVLSVTTIDRTGALRERGPEDYEISYRHAVLKTREDLAQPAEDEGGPIDTIVRAVHRATHTPQEWFVAAHFGFPKGEGAASEQKIKELLDRRLASQPLDQPNAGSVFLNPEGHHAARLIEACGLRGLTIGGAQVSTKHANFIVNLGNATAADIEALIEKVQTVVEEQQGVRMESEVRIVGEK